MVERIKLLAQMAATLAATDAGPDADFDADFYAEKALRILEATERAYQRQQEAALADANRFPGRGLESDYDPHDPLRQ